MILLSLYFVACCSFDELFLDTCATFSSVSAQFVFPFALSLSQMQIIHTLTCMLTHIIINRICMKRTLKWYPILTLTGLAQWMAIFNKYNTIRMQIFHQHTHTSKTRLPKTIQWNKNKKENDGLECEISMQCATASRSVGIKEWESPDKTKLTF